MSLSSNQVPNKKAEIQFLRIVSDYAAQHFRDLPWRKPEADGSYNPYKIMVSELMLQQTQVARVIPKYHEFLEYFPTVEKLSDAPLSSVLKAWQGLGYNRRAKYLHDAAKVIVAEYGGILPKTRDELMNLPGIGSNTAGAIMAYAYNKPEVFIETNIRTVFLHHFFIDRYEVSDTDIIKFAGRTIPRDNPRLWYWALMDYGTYLKKVDGNPNTRSKHYVRQSRFEGSKRQVRGAVLRQLGTAQATNEQLKQHVSDDRLDEVLIALQNEELIYYRDGVYRLGQP